MVAIFQLVNLPTVDMFAKLMYQKEDYCYFEHHRYLTIGGERC